MAYGLGSQEVGQWKEQTLHATAPMATAAAAAGISTSLPVGSAHSSRITGGCKRYDDGRLHTFSLNIDTRDQKEEQKS
jgi:hypothetical protein